MPEPRWIKSSFSEEGGNNCVEIAATDPDRIALRESERPAHELATGQAGLAALLRSLKAGLGG